MLIGQLHRLRVLLALALALTAAPALAVIDGVVDGGLAHQQWPVGVLDPSSLPPEFGGQSCSGLAIAPEWVLTAGHCGPLPLDIRLGFYAPVDVDSCGGPNGRVFEVFTDPDHDVELLHLHDVCGFHFPPFILNDGAPPVLGTKLHDMGWGNSVAAPLTGTTTVSAKSGLAADEIAFTGTNLFCASDDGGPHFDYGTNGFPVAYAIFSYGDAACAQYNVSVRIDALISFITSHVPDVCLRSDPTGPFCEGLFRNGFDPALN
jgi:hypothetical protein